MRLFISYAREDKYIVRQLVEILRNAGLDPWFDNLITVGRDWKEQLRQAIVESETFVYTLSPESIVSEWCQWEFSEAVALGKPIIPILLRTGTDLPENLGRYQYADFSEGPTLDNVPRLLGAIWSLRIIVPPSDIVSWEKQRPSGIPAHVDIKLEVPEISGLLPSPLEWVIVPQGNVTIKNWEWDDDDITNSFTVDTFAIGKYPITNEQFSIFINAPDGYTRDEWWKAVFFGRNGRVEEVDYLENRPHETRWNYDGEKLLPVSTTRYDAIAFCRWLTYKVGHTIVIPPEGCWQRAAQGDDDRLYPWGNLFDPFKCNTIESGINRPTPVTKYSKGASPYGVMDMVGNVAEWVVLHYDSVGTHPAIHFFDSGVFHVRGGCFDKDATEARCISRGYSGPPLPEVQAGFRIATNTSIVPISDDGESKLNAKYD